MPEPRTSIARPRLVGALLGLALLLLGGVALASIMVFPAWLHPPLTDRELAGISDPKDRLAAQDARRQRQDAARATLLQGVGALLVFTSAGVGAYFTWRQVRHNREQLEATREQLELARRQADDGDRHARAQLDVARQGQVTERFTRAIDQLGSPDLDIRLGGIYALERIARDSKADRSTIGEVLTAYIRTHSPWPPTRPGQGRANLTLEQIAKLSDLHTRLPDVQAALTVLGRGGFANPAAEGAGRLRLRPTDLRRADLEGAHLAGADLLGAHLAGAVLAGARLEQAVLAVARLEGADLRGARLEKAVLAYAHLEKARLCGAHLENAVLIGAALEEANLVGACLEEADLTYAHLEKANLVDADLEEANLFDAHLERANLLRANLEKADLAYARLEEADLRGARLEGAVANTLTHWPDGFDWQAAGVLLAGKNQELAEGATANGDNAAPGHRPAPGHRATPPPTSPRQTSPRQTRPHRLGHPD